MESSSFGYLCFLSIIPACIIKNKLSATTIFKNKQELITYPESLDIVVSFVDEHYMLCITAAEESGGQQEGGREVLFWILY